MKRLSLALVLGALLLPSAARLDADGSFPARRFRGPAAAPYKSGEVIVKFQNAVSQGHEERAILEAGGLRARQAPYGGHYVVSLDAGVGVEDAVARFRAMPDVEYAEPNILFRAAFNPNDNYFRFQWNFEQIGANRTWDIQKGQTDVAIAVIDTGIAYEDFGVYRRAPDWGSRVFLQGHDFVNDDDHANDDDSHGTHVASTIGEATDNGEGVAGLAFDCALMPVKVLDNNGNGFLSDVAAGIDYAINFTQNGTHPVKVINMSLGADSPSETLRRAVERAEAAGIVVVAASGNDGEDGVDYPAAYPTVIAVGAVDQRKLKTSYSNFGAELDLVAPGGDVEQDANNDGDPDGILQQTFDPFLAATQGRYDAFAYWYFDGTSQATPHVSAAAALLITQGITLPSAVRKALFDSAEDLGTAGRDDRYGNGLVRPAEALKGLGLIK